jgi:photosystem II stability/assembly factor-like uncharacterized protein
MQFAAFVLLVSVLHAQEFGALKWRNIGPNRGGRSIAIAGSARRPNEYYFGATGGGLWKTTDGGTSWAPVTDGQVRSSSVGAVAVAESDPDVVYLGMGETELRASILLGDGMYKSMDAGKTWLHIGLEKTQTIARIRVHPRNPEIVWVAALGHPYGANEERGIFRTRDGGRTWQRVLHRGNLAGAIDLALDPRNPDVLYASIWDVYRKPWLLSSGGPASGLFQSTDGGDTWKEITGNPGLPRGVLGKICVSVSGADSRRVYATIEADDGGLFRSDDAGAIWTRVNEDRAIRQRAFYYTRTYADPRDRDTVYVLNVEFYKSTDGGKTFHTLQTPHSDHHDLWIAPDDPKRMAEADDGGGSVSVNGGQTWTREEYPTAQFYHVATTLDMPYHVCGAQQDDGTACVVSSAGLGAQESEGPAHEVIYSVAGGEAAYIAPSPSNANVFFSGTQAGLMTRFDRASGATRDITVDPLFFSGMSAQSLRERWQWVFPIVLSPADPKVLYASSQHLFKSTSEGQSWQRISPDLTRAAPETLGDSGGPITKDQNGPEIYATIYSVAPSPRDANLIWTGSDDGIVHLTRDGGKTWAKITPPALPEFSRISMVEASPHQPGTAYLAAKRYELDDLRPLAFRTDDYGSTWTSIVDGIAASDFVHVVREDPARAGLLYAGTEHGVYVSFDRGGHWQSLSLNLPDTPVVDLVVKGDDLVIATHGRSFWVLDDIAMLREWTPAISRSILHLFAPRPAVRGLRAASIDFFLAGTPPKASVEILAPDGTLVRRLDCTCRPGSNRVTWNLAYPGPVTFPGIVLRYASPREGPTARPGTYAVRVTAGGQTETRPLAVERDPRVPGVSDADLERQFQLALKLRDAESQAHQMVIRIRAIVAQIRDRKLAAGEPLAVKLGRLEESLYQVRNRSPRDTLNYPIRLNNQLAVLGRLVNMGDYPPTEQQETVYRELAEKLGQIRDAFETSLAVDLKKLNDALAAEKQQPVK